MKNFFQNTRKCRITAFFVCFALAFLNAWGATSASYDAPTRAFFQRCATFYVSIALLIFINFCYVRYTSFREPKK